MGALADCEAIVDSFLGQRVNSITTLAFVVAAFVVWRWSTRVWVAIGLSLTGVGSFFFHGPMPSWAQVAHDVSLWFLVVIVIVEIGRDLLRTREWRPLVGPLTLLAVVAVIGRLGATGNPLCDPASIWQPHGLWHIGAATAVTWWAVATAPKTPMTDHS
ncbi:MAG TPA: hypothetical protein VFS66_08230 [Acidimicrobiia bacterium]|nr:hypothetical protein [Acidimicrobiia bacterium]